MNFKLRAGLFLCGFLVIFVAVPQSVRAQRVLSPTDIQKELVNATETRAKNREKVVALFSSKDAERALKGAGMDPAQVKTAVATLSDAELAQMAARSDKMRDDFAAGKISNRDLLFIIVGIAVVILIIVAA